ncbi:MAG: hypothetical protein ACFFA4_06550 [Promethearchaeota archaeon]
MVQVLDKNKELKHSLVLEEIIILEELPIEGEYVEESKVIEHKKPPKRVLSKLLKKAKLNANYLKEIERIEDVKNKLNYRNRAIF